MQKKWIILWVVLIGGGLIDIAIQQCYLQMTGSLPIGFVYIINSIWTFAFYIALRHALAKPCPRCGHSISRFILRFPGKPSCSHCGYPREE